MSIFVSFIQQHEQIVWLQSQDICLCSLSLMKSICFRTSQKKIPYVFHDSKYNSIKVYLVIKLRLCNQEKFLLIPRNKRSYIILRLLCVRFFICRNEKRESPLLKSDLQSINIGHMKKIRLGNLFYTFPFVDMSKARSKIPSQPLIF